MVIGANGLGSCLEVVDGLELLQQQQHATHESLSSGSVAATLKGVNPRHTQSVQSLPAAVATSPTSATAILLHPLGGSSTSSSHSAPPHIVTIAATNNNNSTTNLNHLMQLTGSDHHAPTPPSTTTATTALTTVKIEPVLSHPQQQAPPQHPGSGSERQLNLPISAVIKGSLAGGDVHPPSQPGNSHSLLYTSQAASNPQQPQSVMTSKRVRMEW